MDLESDLWFTFQILRVNLKNECILVLRKMHIQTIALHDIVYKFMRKGSNHTSPLCNYKCSCVEYSYDRFFHGDAIIEILAHIDQSFTSPRRIFGGVQIEAADTAVAYYEISGLFDPFASYHSVAIYSADVLDNIFVSFEKNGISGTQRKQSTSLYNSHGYKLSMILKTSLHGNSNIIERYLNTEEVINIIFTTYHLLNDYPSEVKILKSSDHNLRAHTVDYKMSDY